MIKRLTILILIILGIPTYVWVSRLAAEAWIWDKSMARNSVESWITSPIACAFALVIGILGLIMAGFIIYGICSAILYITKEIKNLYLSCRNWVKYNSFTPKM